MISAQAGREKSIRAAANDCESELPKSHASRVTKQGKFEAFVLEHMPDCDYADYLRNLKADLAAPAGRPRRAFQKPSSGVLLVYAKVLRADGPSVIEGVAGRNFKYNYIKTLLSSINATIKEFGSGMSTQMCSQLRQCTTTWQDEDETKSAPAFCMEKGMKLCWTNMASSGWAKIDILQWWSMLLVAICVMARAAQGSLSRV